MRRKVEREEILEKGLEVMLLKGYEGTGVQDLAAASNILKGSFYNYFKSKEEFTKALISFYASNAESLTNSILSDKSLKPLKRLKKLFEKYWSTTTGNNGYSGGCFLGNCSLEIGNTIPSLSEEVNKAFNSSVKSYADCIKEAKLLGDLKNTDDPETLAEFILLGWQGVLLRSKTSKNDIAYKSFMKLIFEKVLV